MLGPAVGGEFMEFITGEHIDPSEVYPKVHKLLSGSVILHIAIVREMTGMQVTHSIDFQRNGDIETELREISEELKRRWNIEDSLIIRRLGLLRVHEVMSVVAVSAPHRGDAFDACRFGVESLKRMKTIIKEEQRG